MIEPLFLNLDDPSDWVRLVLMLSCLCSAIILLIKYKHKSKSWNSKTKDYWYSLLMWSIAGISFGIEGIYKDRPPGPTLVFVFAAAVVTAIGVKKPGNWGDDSA